MKLNLLLLLFLPAAIYAQDGTTIDSGEQYPNTFSSGSKNIHKFDNKSRRFRDWSVSVGGGGSFMAFADLKSFYDKKMDLGWNTYVSVDKQISHTVGMSVQYQMGETKQRGQLPGAIGELAGIAEARTKYQQVSVLGDINFTNLLRRVDNHSPYRWAFHGYVGIGLQAYKTILIDGYLSQYAPKTFPIQVEQKLGLASFFYQGGLGVKYKVSKLIDVEMRGMYIMSGDDEFDGGGTYRETAIPGLDYNLINDTYTDDMITVNLGLTFKFGKHVSHLTWHDPLEEIYFRIGMLENSLGEDIVVCERGDRDNDGVCDDWDRQLDTPAGARVDGAGVALDMDLDKVIDLNDKCVVEPGPIENDGCPIIEKPIVVEPPKPVINSIEDINRELEGIEFELNKAVIRPQSYGKLDNAADIIKTTLNPNDRFLVIGATDTRGSDAYNLTLSQKRADAVVKYLVGKGVTQSMLIPEGRGEKDLKYPECDPATKCEEWKNEANRRVYFNEAK
ncbi:MAG: OmpA family protein [Flavobacteriaceae bacterium]|jgi:OOP family OmpA-OmpF porin|nr:OmpA family protein [Flavobacteriaceae bacterium]